MQELKHSLTFKIASILLLVILLMIPTSMVKNLITERSEVHTSAVHEISEKWGAGQQVVAPFISVPYDKFLRSTDSDGKERVTKYKE
jgi:inner membrane protein